MLDYEILSYKVQYFVKETEKTIECLFETKKHSERLFETEEGAIEFIKNNRDQWKYYRLIQYQTAIIDF